MKKFAIETHNVETNCRNWGRNSLCFD